MKFSNIISLIFIVVLALLDNATSDDCIKRYGKCSKSNSNCCEPAQCYFSFNQCF
uniref:Venom ptu1 family peptide pp3 n=1 Tax=Pristhesancus plagipennis TaxID=1955184 RepID=A0A1Q1NPD5_PRIPG|nr:venom ptu1 family peptide pp3 [Pristhesancus plagipennis]